MMTLKNKVEIIVPKYDNGGNEISSPVIKSEINIMTKLAGGNTITEVKGQWYSEDEERIMQDDNLNIEWYYDKDMEDAQSFVLGLSVITRVLILQYHQEAVSVKIDNVLYIIDIDDLYKLSNTLYDLMF
uniref:ATP-dependent DNA ligase n=1 Tax=Mammaliicoccus phage MSShimriz1 TaxID=3230127 RepID=A0AAU8GSJ9_9VIRU